MASIKMDTFKLIRFFNEHNIHPSIQEKDGKKITEVAERYWYRRISL